MQLPQESCEQWIVMKMKQRVALLQIKLITYDKNKLHIYKQVFLKTIQYVSEN